MSSHCLDALRIPAELQGNVTNEYYKYIKLSQGIEEGNIEAVTDFLNQHPEAVDAWINLYETPLLKTCACSNPEIVKELLRRMTTLEQMLPKPKMMNQEVQDKHYHTPLTIVAATGNMEIAEALVAKNPKLLEIPGISNEIPVEVAVENAQVEMARYLYIKTPIQVLFDQGGYHATRLLNRAIDCKMLDIALDLFGICRRLPVTKHRFITMTPIIFLASNPDLFKGGCRNLGPLTRFIYSCVVAKLPSLAEEFCSTTKDDNLTLLGKLLNHLLTWTGIDQVYQMKVMHLQVKKLLHGISEETLAMDLEERSQTVDKALQHAARYGNVEFLVEMVKHNSELLWSSKESSSDDLFFLAIQYRQKAVLNFLYGLKQRHLLLTGHQWKGTGVLHLAALQAPPERLATIAGAASQMQSEFKWFKEIEGITPEIEKDRSSALKIEEVQPWSDNPFELFSDTHKQLRIDAEKSMKDMAGSCSLVAVLIVTVTFAAVFTVPGGTDKKTRGTPFHVKERPFMIFVVSDVISCLTACTSVLIFLAILTSLPTKMIAGLTLIFISIAAMLIAFWSALFTMLNEKSWLPTPVVAVACFPAILFVRLQFPLLRDMIVSTYGQGILDRSVPPTNNRSVCSQLKTFVVEVTSSSINYLCCQFKN